MNENQRLLLSEQIHKLEVLSVLEKNFADEAVDEISFISIACGNLKGMVE